MNEQVAKALAEARALGFLGPGPLEVHEASAQAFIAALGAVEGAALDLGSGGGVPGLLLAAHYRDVTWTLLDIHRRRTSFLVRTVALLGWADRVSVVRESADVAARGLGLRAQMDVVVARSFASPAITAECAAGFLRVGGRLAVAEPPDSAPGDRWDEPELARLGLASESAGRIAIFRQVALAADTTPRTWRSLTRAPLWERFT